MDLPIASLTFLRIVMSALSLTEATRNRPDVEQTSPGVCWTVAFFSFLTSLAIESRLPKLEKHIPGSIFYTYMLGATVLFVGVLFTVRTPKTADGIEGIPLKNIWSGFWQAGALITLGAQLALIFQTKKKGFPFKLVISNALGAMGSVLFFLSGLFTATEFVSKDVFYFNAVYNWYMKASNVWIAASAFYFMHSITLVFGLIAPSNVPMPTS